MGKLSKDRRDIYYRKAKSDGFRARSAYKLLQLDAQFNLFNNANHIVDLCAAPGSWSQVCVERLKKRIDGAIIVAIDLQEMAPIEHVVQIQGDITAQATVDSTLQLFNGELVDLVLCDGAPDVTGLHDMDEYVQCQLLFSALQIATKLLKEGGTFVAKVFRGENMSLLNSQLLLFFSDVYCCKPASSRNSSYEAFVVCRNFRDGPTIGRSVLGADIACHPSSLANERLVRFVACGDAEGLDSDRTYNTTAPYLPPVQPPINAPYEDSIKEKRQTNSLI